MASNCPSSWDPSENEINEGAQALQADADAVSVCLHRGVGASSRSRELPLGNLVSNR